MKTFERLGGKLRSLCSIEKGEENIVEIFIMRILIRTFGVMS